MRLTDVATRAGVSPTTVSRVLNNRGYISEKTREKVHEAMRELGYTPNALARSLRGSRTHTVGLIFPTVAHPFYGHMTHALEHAFSAHGYRVLLCNSDGNEVTERAHLEMLMAQQVDGIVTGAHSSLAQLSTLRAPLISIDRQVPGDHPNVRTANQRAAQDACEGLIARGAVRVVHLTSSSSESSPRSDGYVRALQRNGWAPRVVRVSRGLEWSEDTRQVFEALDALWTQGEVDAVFASNDTLALRALHWARVRSIDVPGDLQIMGFDGARSTVNSVPELSTVVQPFEEIAAVACSLMIDTVEGRTGEDALTLAGPAFSSSAEGVFELEARMHWGETTRKPSRR